MRKYLIVDDNRAFAENLGEILVDAGAEADVVTVGPEAIERVQRIRYDALITDMRMPVMGGAELVHRLRRVDPGLPVVVLTAYTDDEDLAAARQEGLLAVLPKPVPLQLLLEILRGARRDALVALVEDDLALSDNLTEALRARGYATVTATSVLETERIGNVRPFVALVDLRLPGGEDGAAMSRLAATFPGLPMLVMSGLADITPAVPCLRIFAKPFQTAELVEAVDRVHRSQHE